MKLKLTIILRFYLTRILFMSWTQWVQRDSCIYPLWPFSQTVPYYFQNMLPHLSREFPISTSNFSVKSIKKFFLQWIYILAKHWNDSCLILFQFLFCFNCYLFSILFYVSNRVQSKSGGLFKARCMDVSSRQPIKFGRDWRLIGWYAVHGQNACATHQTE